MRITTFLLLLSALVGCTRTQVHERTEEQVVKMPPASIRVELTSGSVSLTVTRALDATVRAIWSTSDGDRTAAEVRLMQCDLGIDTDSGTFEINPKMPENVSVSLVITLPDTQGVIINTGNGSIDVNGASGSAMLTSGNGAIRCVDNTACVGMGLVGDCCPDAHGQSQSCCHDPLNVATVTTTRRGACDDNSACAALKLQGACCPDSSGNYLGCCKSSNNTIRAPHAVAASCSKNSACRAIGLSSGDCCPTDDGTMLGCCPPIQSKLR